jgi:RHS repeat-associated protein
MASATNAGTTATYIYNALGQRIRRTTSSLTTLYVYDEAGHLAGEYTAAGALVQETVWLGDIPVATVRPNGAGGVDLFYVHTDHLNTPRLVTDTANNIRWRWDSDPFGTTTPNENPTSLGTFEYNLRFPGQQYDGVVGLHYNYFRDYDPALGKYVESDPIGLVGGLNTYSYAYLDPAFKKDPDGANAVAGIRGAWWMGTRIGAGIGFAIEAGTGLTLGVLIYNACHDAEEERCRKAEDACHEECKHLLGKSRLSQGTPYRSCRIRCMKNAGCYKGDMAVE